MNVSSYKTSFIRVLQLSQSSCTLLALLPLNLTQWEWKPPSLHSVLHHYLYHTIRQKHAVVQFA